MADVFQRGEARQDVFAGGGGAGQHVGIAIGQFDQQRAHGLSQLMSVNGVIGNAYFVDAVEFCGGVCRCLDAFAGDQNINFTTDGLSGGDHVGGGAGQLAS
ncbi:hypothetical protein HSBAA_25590 [Vreelandella sulfidaeris]|uniref:Uncharacterized protein n=1 Tax=Vreelandella sulfidaeris TaxID=115553 RepID=A0A455U7T0_9GAMM|nr:hypothetical protein HSBAA_25590 [Halomonas sulfidaeris]